MIEIQCEHCRGFRHRTSSINLDVMRRNPIDSSTNGSKLKKSTKTDKNHWSISMFGININFDRSRLFSSWRSFSSIRWTTNVFLDWCFPLIEMTISSLSRTWLQRQVSLLSFLRWWRWFVGSVQSSRRKRMRRTIGRSDRHSGADRTRCHVENDSTQTVRDASRPMERTLRRRFSRLYERTIDDLEIIYDELLHVKALSHLSSVVKRELASVLIFEAHPFKGKVCKSAVLLPSHPRHSIGR